MKYVSIFVYLILCCNQMLSGQDVHFRKITSSQGLTHNTVYAITQDEQGFIWFGTREGLNRFDSYKLKTYYINSSGLGNSVNKINTLFSDRGLMYVGTEDGLYIYDSRIDQLKPSQSFPVKTTVLSISKHQGKIYIGTTSGLYQLSDKGYRRLSPSNNFVKAFCAVSENHFLAAFGNSLQIIDAKGAVKRTFSAPLGEGVVKKDFAIHDIYRDSRGQIWISTNDGLINYNYENHRFSKLKFSKTETQETKTVRSVFRNKRDLLYIGTEDGLYIYNFRTRSSERYDQSFSNDPKKLNDKSIYSIFISGDGSVWIGTYFGGVNYLPSSIHGFKTIRSADKADGLAGKAVSQMMEDNKGRIWIGTEDGGISIYNPSSESYSHINTKTAPFYLAVNNVHSIHDDGYGNIWVGTFLGGLHQFDTRNNTTTIYTKQADHAKSLSNNHVYAVYRDSRGKLWVATQSGLNIFDYQRKNFTHFKPEIFGAKFIYDLIEDKNGDLWFCTRQDGIYRYNAETDRLQHYSAFGNKPVLPGNQVISVYKDSKQQLWFGTLDGGVSCYNIDTDKFKSYSIANGLANNNVYGILEDDRGDVWFTTNKGISRLENKSGKITNYDTRDGLPSNQFNFKSFLKSQSGVLYFGSINGLCFFNPASITASKVKLPLVFTDFQLFNQSVLPGRSEVLEQQINYSKNVELRYSQNVFTINFAAINYANPASNRYAYYLEGFEKKWNYVVDKNNITYTNLSPGYYIFHLKAVNSAGQDVSEERLLNIHVKPPFYLSRPAYFIYILLAGLLIWLYTRFIKFLHKKELEVQLERIEKEKIKELTQHRLNFFTFISHEFKTPLTLILASIDKFIQDRGPEFKKSSELNGIKNNASILFKLIQQLMEFRKIETDHAEVRLIKTDLVKFVEEVLFSFQDITSRKRIQLSFSCQLEQFYCYFDKDKIEKICYNLLSNAVKNTEDGKVELTLRTEQKEENLVHVLISISDTGRGMSPKEVKNVFNPFYKASENRKITTEGSGVGMALVQSLVNYLNGKIAISSEPGKGTEVQVTLPVFTKLSEQEASVKEDKQASVKEPESRQEDEVFPITATERVEAGKYTLLIVEDNRKLLNFLADHFSKTYKVVTASNGAIGLNKIYKSPPDIIISDIKMPKMDGFELCERIKKDEQYAYLPVILLSENSAENVKLNGFDSGADAYISKPFNLKEFELLISNMIKSRVKLRERLAAHSSFIGGKLPKNNKDQEFLLNLSEVVEKHYTNPEVTTEEIAAKLNMSRTLLHLTLKRLLNKSANQMLNDFRLEKAVIMLENDLPVAEIAYHCGYSDPNYFSRIFKARYNVTPKQYKSGKPEKV